MYLKQNNGIIALNSSGVDKKTKKTKKRQKNHMLVHNNCLKVITLTFYIVQKGQLATFHAYIQYTCTCIMS